MAGYVYLYPAQLLIRRRERELEYRHMYASTHIYTHTPMYEPQKRKYWRQWRNITRASKANFDADDVTWERQALPLQSRSGLRKMSPNLSLVSCELGQVSYRELRPLSSDEGVWTLGSKEVSKAWLFLTKDPLVLKGHSDWSSFLTLRFHQGEKG